MTLTNVVFLDIETTGLDPRFDAILEVAIVHFPVFSLKAGTEISADDYVIHYDRGALHMGNYVTEMHTVNGLLEECYASTYSQHDVTQYLCKTLPVLPDGEKYTLAGDSVHFDLSFLRGQMISFAERFSHRLLDLSAVALFAKSHGIDLPKALPAHRALLDCKASIQRYETLTEALGLAGAS